MKSGVDVVVHGRVQGVFFRAFTLEVAEEYGLVGWVCNQADGTVSLHASGKAGDLQLLLNKLETGPLLAKVQHLEIKWCQAQDFKDFTIIR